MGSFRASLALAVGGALGLGSLLAASSPLKVVTSGNVGIKTGSPTATLEGNGSIAFGVWLGNDAVRVAGDEKSLLVTSFPASGNVAILLPSASRVTGREYVIKKNTTATGNVYVQSAEGLDSGLTAELSGNGYPFVRVVSGGDKWYLAGNSSTMVISNKSSVSEGLIGYWRFEESSGNSATDSSGKGNTGTLGSGFNFTGNSVTGKVGQALKFNGTSHYVSCASSTVLNVSQLTIAAWVRPTTLVDDSGSMRTILSRFDSAGSGSAEPYGLRVGNITKLPLFQWDNSGFRVVSAPVSTANQVLESEWTHLAFTVNASLDATFYRNGVASGNSILPAALASGTRKLYIGGFYDGSLGSWSGDLDEVRLYNRALSAAEVKALADFGQ